jgi:hypothetical protein
MAPTSVQINQSINNVNAIIDRHNSSATNSSYPKYLKLVRSDIVNLVSEYPKLGFIDYDIFYMDLSVLVLSYVILCNTFVNCL